MEKICKGTPEAAALLDSLTAETDESKLPEVSNSVWSEVSVRLSVLRVEKERAEREALEQGEKVALGCTVSEYEHLHKKKTTGSLTRMLKRAKSTMEIEVLLEMISDRKRHMELTTTTEINDAIQAYRQAYDVVSTNFFPRSRGGNPTTATASVTMSYGRYDNSTTYYCSSPSGPQWLEAFQQAKCRKENLLGEYAYLCERLGKRYYSPEVLLARHEEAELRKEGILSVKAAIRLLDSMIEETTSRRRQS